MKSVERIVSIRGAITVKENSVKEIKNATKIILSEILKRNKLDKSKVINIIFTVTDDLNLVNPATIAREEFKLYTTPMLCLQEMKVKGSLKKCIRMMVTTYINLYKNKILHIYLGKAEGLRPDLSQYVQ